MPAEAEAVEAVGAEAVVTAVDNMGPSPSKKISLAPSNWTM